MIREILLYLFPLISCVTSLGQNSYLDIVEDLPAALNECSGMAYLPGGKLAMINDSGNAPKIFITDTNGIVLKVIDHPDLRNDDWEELAYSEPYLFIGDFGNNANRRQNLKIYKVKLSHELEAESVETISFSYADQKEFPPEKTNRNYDMEAMVALNDSLFLFSKNRTKPFDGYTHVYSLPQKPGSYQLKPGQKYLTGTGPRECQWVTAACLNPEKDRLYLLGYHNMWVFDIRNSQFFANEPQLIEFDEFTQKEAITISPAGNIYISDEKNLFDGGFLYRLKLKASH